MNLRSLALLTLVSSVGVPYASSQIAVRTLAASAPAAVPPLVPYSGQIAGRTGQASATFLIFKDQTGDEPLFTESQTVALDEAGRYQVQLGAASPSGLPSDLFPTGEARWLEVQIAGQPAEPRILLASVPYALKAADAATLGGLPASAFLLAGSNVAVANAVSAAITPDAASTVTTTGGTANKVAKFSGSNTIVNSILYDNGTDVGIGTTAPTATLTVDGTMTVDGVSNFYGPLILPPVATATSSKSYPSEILKLYTSAYNSSTKAVVQPHFEWEAEVTGNDTSAPNGTLNLLASATSAAPVETGLYINTNGTIHFASGQTFGSTSSSGVAVNGASTSGTGVEGTSISGSGVVGNSSSTTGDLAGVTGLNSSNGGVGVFGAGSALSSIGQSMRGNGAGVWGDSAISFFTSNHPAVIGTADNQYAGLFYNNSTSGIQALSGYNLAEEKEL